MSNPIPAVPGGSGGLTGASAFLPPSGEAGSGEFLKTLQDAMGEVGQLQSEADSRVNQLLTGNGQDVHSAMIAVQKAGLAFEMMVQVRNKIVQAYQQVSGMQF